MAARNKKRSNAKNDVETCDGEKKTKGLKKLKSDQLEQLSFADLGQLIWELFRKRIQTGQGKTARTYSNKWIRQTVQNQTFFYCRPLEAPALVSTPIFVCLPDSSLRRRNASLRKDEGTLLTRASKAALNATTLKS